MAERQLFLRTLALRWRFRPRLEFYNRFNDIGLAIEKDFSDWKRSNLQHLFMACKERHRFLALVNGDVAYQRHFREAGETDSELDFALRLHRQHFSNFGQTTYKYLGICCRYALRVDQSFESSVAQLGKKLFVRCEMLNEVFAGERVDDMQYVVDFRPEKGHVQKLRIGPMTRNEWFETIKYDEEFLFSAGGESPNSFASYKISIPDPLVFFELDFYWEDVSSDPETVEGRLRGGFARIEQSVRSFITYYKAS